MEIAVIYWSGTGNTKMMAEAVAEGIAEAGAQAVVKSVSEITPDEAVAYDKIAFGCSAMGAEVLEETEFEPFFTMVEDNLKGKKVVLFGSYGWGGSYMQDWEVRVQADGAEHGTGVHIDVAHLRRKAACQRGFACPGRPVNRNRYHFYLSFLL